MTVMKSSSAASISFAVNRASDKEISGHLARCDAHFVPRLSSRVDLDAYTKKILSHAERFEAWSANELVALVAVYANDSRRHAAFVTSVSVVPERRGEGIAKRLMQNCIHHARRLGFERVSLRVDRDQADAIGLYESCGFSRVQGESAATGPGSDIIMTLEFREAAARHARL